MLYELRLSLTAVVCLVSSMPLARANCAETGKTAREVIDTPADDRYLAVVQHFLDTMIDEGTDRYGSVHGPMFASILDLRTRRIPVPTPPAIPGQRQNDRAPRGGNLFHDVMLLRAGDLVTDITGKKKYRQATTEYLTFFLANCPQKTGLFPWGEHAHWDFFDERPGNPIHEYLGGVPWEFWERMWAIDPVAVRAEADGLLEHVVDLGTFSFNRHARLDEPLPTPRPLNLPALDFPRHAGFYVGVWTFVAAQAVEPAVVESRIAPDHEKQIEWSRRIIDHHWRVRHRRFGVLPGATDPSRIGTAGVAQTLSLSISLLESARLLPQGAAREHYERAGRGYLDGVLRLEHRPDRGQLVTAFGFPAEGQPPRFAFSDPFHQEYGATFSGDGACLLVAAHRLTGDPRALDLARQFGQFYLDHDPPAADQLVRADVYASIIGLLLDLYESDGDPRLLAGARHYADLAIERLYVGGLFRGAHGLDYYESELRVANLVYNLVWLHAVQGEVDVAVPPNYFSR